MKASPQPSPEEREINQETMNSELAMQERVIEVLKTVFDPEIPVNIYDLGLIYRIELSENNTALIYTGLYSLLRDNDILIVQTIDTTVCI